MRVNAFIALLTLFSFAGCLDGDSDSGDDSGDDPMAPTGEPLFFDGAENGTGQWTFASNYVVIDFTGNAPAQELDQAHPAGSWQVSTTEAHNGTSSYYSQYPDNYRARMSMTVTPSNATELTFWYKGGAEANAYDGLHVFVGGAEVALIAEPVADWTFASFAVPAAATLIEFRFDADPSCSNESPPAQVGDPAGTCGAGWEAGGIYIDDITVL